MSRVNCPTPLKAAFTADDVHVYAAVERGRDARVSGQRPTTYYRCRCGAWHVTGGSNNPYTAKRSKAGHRDKKNSQRKSGRRVKNNTPRRPR